MAAALSGGDDVISMPRYFKRWDQGLPDLRKQLRKVDSVGYFSILQRKALAQHLSATGIDPNQPQCHASDRAW